VKDLNQEGELMIQQAILPFKMERTDELVTPRSGLGLLAEVVRTLGVLGKIEAAFPRPGSNRGYEAWAYIEPLVLMLAGGGRHIEDLREIRDDAALRAMELHPGLLDRRLEEIVERLEPQAPRQAL
jgi:hypothetical protein